MFWAAVITLGTAFGILTVLRAEVPRQRVVPQPQYSSPVQMGEKSDTQADYRSSEFREFRAIAWGAVVEDLDPYTDLGHVRAYPPFFAIAFFPFALLWRCRGAGSALFFLVSYGGGLLAAWCLARWWQRKEETPRFGLFAVTWLILAPFLLAVIVRCESDMLVLVPMAVALLWTARGQRTFGAGVLLGFAASFKVLPGLFGVFLLAQRRWRPLAGMMAGGLVCTVLLPVLIWGPHGALQRHRSWYNHVVAPYHKEGAAGVIGPRVYRSTNQSLTAAVYRFLTPIQAGKGDDLRQVNLARLSPQAAGRIASALRAVIGVGLLIFWIFCLRKDESPALRAALFATVPLGTLLLSEVSIGTHHVVLVVPCAVILARAVGLADGAAQRRRWAVAAALGLCLVGALPTIHLLSPMLFTTLLLLAATGAIALDDCRRRSRAT